MNAPSSRVNRSVAAAMVEGLGLPQPPRISIANGRFSLVDRAGNELPCTLMDPQLGWYIDVVIAAANPKKSRLFYENDWVPGSTEPPVCWSDNGVAPSVQAISPQANTCAICEWNKIGSDTSKRTGKNIKACQDRKKLAVFVMGDPRGELYQLQISPGSLKNLTAYGNHIAKHPNPDQTGPADVSDVITRLSMDPQAVGIICFMPVAAVDNQIYQRINHVWDNGSVAEIVGLNDTPIPSVLSPPAAAPALAAPQPQPHAPAGGYVPVPPQHLPPPNAFPQQAQQPPAQAAPAVWTPPQQPAQQAATPPPKPEPVWNAATGQWEIPALHPAATGYPAASQPPQPQQQWQPVNAPTATPPQNGAAPPSTGTAPRSGRGGARAGAGRRGANQQAAQAQGQPAQTFTPQPQPPGQAYGAPPAPQTAPFVQQQGTAAAQPQPGHQPHSGMTPAGAPPFDMAAALDKAFATALPPR